MYLNLKDEFLKLCAKFSVNFISAEHKRISRHGGIYYHWAITYSLSDGKSRHFETGYKQRAQRPKTAADAFENHLESVCGDAGYPDLNQYASLLLGRKIFDYRKPKEIFLITGLHYGPQGTSVRYARKGVGSIAKKLRPEHRLVCRPMESQTRAEAKTIHSLNTFNEIRKVSFNYGEATVFEELDGAIIKIPFPILPKNLKAMQYCLEQDLDVFGLCGKLK